MDTCVEVGVGCVGGSMAAAPPSISMSISLDVFVYNVAVAIIGAAGADELRFPEPPALGGICTVALWSHQQFGPL